MNIGKMNHNKKKKTKRQQKKQVKVIDNVKCKATTETCNSLFFIQSYRSTKLMSAGTYMV